MANETIISRLVTRLNGATASRDMPDIATRNFGGSWRENHPYIGGYFHAIFDLPDALFAGVEDVSTKWLNTTCESFTPPQVLRVV